MTYHKARRAEMFWSAVACYRFLKGSLLPVLRGHGGVAATREWGGGLNPAKASFRSSKRQQSAGRRTHSTGSLPSLLDKTEMHPAALGAFRIASQKDLLSGGEERTY